MKEKFFNKKVDYFWEYEYPFGEFFLKEIFHNQYKRKYSLEGSGIFDLILVDNKIYDISLKQATQMIPSDGKKAFRDDTKNEIIQTICEELAENNIEHSVFGGKFVYFKIGDYIAKMEIVKKAAMPA